MRRSELTLYVILAVAVFAGAFALTRGAASPAASGNAPAEIKRPPRVKAGIVTLNRAAPIPDLVRPRPATTTPKASSGATNVGSGSSGTPTNPSSGSSAPKTQTTTPQTTQSVGDIVG